MSKKNQEDRPIVRKEQSRLPRRKHNWHVYVVNRDTMSTSADFSLSPKRLIIAGIILVVVVLLFLSSVFALTPIGRWIWGDADLRNQYVEMSVRIDSLTKVGRVQGAYMANIKAILTDSIAYDSMPAPMVWEAPDTLLESSAAERMFVEKFESENRFNLSVLTPIAAEGMIFESPIDSYKAGSPVKAVYRGTVMAVYIDAEGLNTVVIQHPNDFISSYGGLDHVYVNKGEKIKAGQRIGTFKTELGFELWHAGTPLEAENYVQFPVPPTKE